MTPITTPHVCTDDQLRRRDALTSAVAIVMCASLAYLGYVVAASYDDSIHAPPQSYRIALTMIKIAEHVCKKNDGAIGLVANPDDQHNIAFRCRDGAIFPDNILILSY